MTRIETGLPRYEDAVQRFRIEDEIATLDASFSLGAMLPR